MDGTACNPPLGIAAAAAPKGWLPTEESSARPFSPPFLGGKMTECLGLAGVFLLSVPGENSIPTR